MSLNRRQIIKGGGALALGAAFPAVAYGSNDGILYGNVRLKSHAAYEYDPSSDSVPELLFEEKGDIVGHTASTTKLSTAFYSWNAIKKGELALDENLLVSHRALKQSSQNIGEEEITVRQALRYMMVFSDNAAATTLALRLFTGQNKRHPTLDVMRMERALGRDMLTPLASNLGLKSTIFGNSTGLPDPTPEDIKKIAKFTFQHSVSTAKELAQFSCALARAHPEVLEDASRPSIQDDNWIRYNTNRTLENAVRSNAAPCEGVVGLKTGYIDVSGLCQVTAVKRMVHGVPRHIILVTLGNTSQQQRNETIHTLTAKGYEMLEQKYKSKPETSPPSCSSFAPCDIV